MSDIVVVGAGGMGREAVWVLEEINRVAHKWNILGFVDDNEELHDCVLNGYKVIGSIEWLKNQRMNVVIAIGDPRTKRRIADELQDSANTYPNIIRPKAVISDVVKMKHGNIVCAGAVVTVNIDIGAYTIISYNCTVGHDVTIGDYTTVLPGANISGNVDVSEGVMLGTGSVVIQGVRIGENTVVGAGSVVINHLPSNCVAVGSPAKKIKQI